MITSLLLLLLPVAAASGWIAARRVPIVDSPVEKNRFVQHYLDGLNYLLNEQPDKAVDTFIKMLEVDNETVETHLALGALFRRRGEVDRAIRIHQNLIARPQLPKKHRMGALLALAQDYLKAGVLDRAERLFLEVIEADSDDKILALSQLLDIYQQQKRWESAIFIANKLLTYGESMQNNIAHYYCELALEAHQFKNEEQREEYLKHAMQSDAHCARASLLLGALALEKNNFDQALQAYLKIKDQDPDFLGEAIPQLTLCFEQVENAGEMIDYLKTTLQEHPRVFILLALVDQLRVKNGIAAAIEYLSSYLRQRPSIRGLYRLTAFYLETMDATDKERLLVLQDSIARFLKGKPSYHCGQCGFASKVLHWHCPGCKDWGSVKPVME